MLSLSIAKISEKWYNCYNQENSYTVSALCWSVVNKTSGVCFHPILWRNSILWCEEGKLCCHYNNGMTIYTNPDWLVQHPENDVKMVYISAKDSGILLVAVSTCFPNAKEFNKLITGIIFQIVDVKSHHAKRCHNFLIHQS